VIGLGLEIVDVSAFRGQLDDPTAALPLTAFSTAEQAEVGVTEPSSARRLAARGAAKLAFLKALSASNPDAEHLLGSPDLSEVEIANDASGKPSLRVWGEVARVATGCLGSDWIALVSLTHEGNTAAAVVVLERRQI